MTTIKLGVDTATGKTVYTSQDQKRQHTYVLGASGTGKSTLLLPLILQDIEQLKGILLLDPHRELSDKILCQMDKRRLKDVILIDIADPTYCVGLNLYSCPNPQDNQKLQYSLERVMHMWEKLFKIGRQTPQMGEYMRDIAETLISNPGYTMNETMRVIRDKPFREMLLHNVRNQSVHDFWQDFENMTPIDRKRDVSAIRNKLTEFVQNFTRPIVGQAQSTIDMRKLMDQSKIVLVKLDRQLEGVTSLIGGVLIAMLLSAAFSRDPNGKHPQFNVYLDEFDSFLTEDIQALYNEARKFSCTITVAHQNRVALLTDMPKLARNILSAGTLITFRVEDKDAQEMSGNLDTTPVPLKRNETYITDVVGHLLKNGHQDHVVNQFVQGTLSLLGTDKDWRIEVSNLNHVLYNGMVNHQTSPKDILAAVKTICYIQHVVVIASVCSAVPDIHFYDYWTTGNSTSFYQKICRFIEENTLRQVTSELFDIQGVMNTSSLRGNSPVISVPPDPNMIAELKQWYGMHRQRPHMNPATPPPSWFIIDIDRIEWEKHTSTTQTDYRGNPFSWDTWRVRSNQEWKFYQPHDLTLTVNQFVANEKQHFEAIVQQLQLVMQALANQPLVSSQGQPNQGTQQTHADRKSQIANMLSNPHGGLPNLTAYVRLNENLLQNPEKECLGCYAMNTPMSKHCASCGIKLIGQGEYMITVQRPTTNCKSVAHLITQINKQNLADGYIRLRTDVEQEIIARQQPPPPPTAPVPNPPPQPAPVAPQVAPPPQPVRPRKVLGGKVCSSCNTNNSASAIFCQQCGNRL